MKIIDMFLREDFLIVRPSIFFYIDKEKSNDLLNKGMKLDKDYLSCYLRRLPEESDQALAYAGIRGEEGAGHQGNGAAPGSSRTPRCQRFQEDEVLKAVF